MGFRNFTGYHDGGSVVFLHLGLILAEPISALEEDIQEGREEVRAAVLGAH
jgi:hypothetical protein